MAGDRWLNSNWGHLLLHDLNVDLLHIHLLIEFGREFGALQQLGVHSGRHGGLFVSGYCCDRWL